MKRTLYLLTFFFSLLVGEMPDSYAQCPGIDPVPNASSYPLYNWERGRFPDGEGKKWEAYINISGSNERFITMPFFRLNDDNATIDPNLTPIQVNNADIPDYMHTDGWEMLTKVTGTSGSIANARDWVGWIMYNKYSSKLRVLIYHGSVLASESDTANICLYFESTRHTVNGVTNEDKYAPNLLAATQDPVVALDSFPDYHDGYLMACQQNKWSSGQKNWMYADFPMSYDPCTCLFQSGIFHIRVTLQKNFHIHLGQASIIGDATRSSMLQHTKGSSTGNSNTDVPSGDPNTTESNSTLETGVTRIKDLSEALKSWNEAIEGLVKDEDTHDNATTQAAKIKKDGTNPIKIAANMAAMFSGEAATFGAVLGMVNFFLGSTSESDGAGGTVFSLTNSNVNLDGVMQETWTDIDMSIPVPGTISTPQVYYNYPLGAFGLLYTPKATVRRGADLGCYSFLGNLNDDPNQAFRDYLLYLEPVEYAINPHLGFDYSKSTISAMLEVEHPGVNSSAHTWTSNGGISYQRDFSYFYRWETEYNAKDFGSLHYAASYTPTEREQGGTNDSYSIFDHQSFMKETTYPININSLSSQVFRLKLGSDYLPSWGTHTFNWQPLSTVIYDSPLDWYNQGEHPQIEVYLKLIGSLVTPDGKKHEFIHRYPVKLDFEGPFDRCPDGSDTPFMNDHVKPYYDKVLSDRNNIDPNNQFQYPSELPYQINITTNQNGSKNFLAFSSITVSADLTGGFYFTSPFPPYTLVWVNQPINVFASHVEILPGSTLSPGVTVEDRDMSNPSQIKGVAPVSTEVITGANGFCQSNIYKAKNIRGATNRVGNEESLSSQDNRKLQHVYAVTSPTFLNSPVNLFMPDGNPISTVRLTSSLGEIIPITITGSDGSYQIRHQATAPGVYTLTVTTSQGVQRKRVVLQ